MDFALLLLYLLNKDNGALGVLQGGFVKSDWFELAPSPRVEETLPLGHLNVSFKETAKSFGREKA